MMEASQPLFFLSHLLDQVGCYLDTLGASRDEDSVRDAVRELLGLRTHHHVGVALALRRCACLYT